MRLPKVLAASCFAGIAALALPATAAFATDAGTAGYGNVTKTSVADLVVSPAAVTNPVAAAQPVVSPAAVTRSLPLTGADIGGIAALAAGSCTIGAALVISSRRRTRATA